MAQIEDLPVGWEWVPAGTKTWITSQGKQSTARHAENRLSGQTMSLRQAQNIQRGARAQRGQPKGPSTPRTGKTRTIKGPYDAKSKSMYRPDIHGRTETLVFRDFNSARNFAALNGLPEWAKSGIIHIRYGERLVSTNRQGSDTLDRNGYASITGFFNTANAQGPDAFSTSSSIPFPWQEAEQRIQNYDMSGKSARVYIVLSER